MRQALRISLLMILLSTGAFAGDMPNGGTPPGSGTQSCQNAPSPGDMPNGAPASATAVTVLLTLLQSIPRLG
jgi:hypothetical protein